MSAKKEKLNHPGTVLDEVCIQLLNLNLSEVITCIRNNFKSLVESAAKI